ncbi:uncharacterized protein LOC126631899 isoform X1 [Malus sylvestris]|uniref:uncharacterized protein LOC126631899 isoform X1 n=1 Tax=Malus sylvestris TaxID=3752 RepID=UPI0021ACA8EC|nr:uncharacterized protein LOC126631899 isoform X1 [Malus sylvestris]
MYVVDVNVLLTSLLQVHHEKHFDDRLGRIWFQVFLYERCFDMRAKNIQISTTEGTVLRRLQRRRLSEIVALLCIRKEMKIKIHLSSALRAVSICAFIELTGARSFLVACQSKESSSSKALQNSKNPGLKIDIGHKLVTALLYPVQKSHVFAGTVMVPETLINIA